MGGEMKSWHHNKNNCAEQQIKLLFANNLEKMSNKEEEVEEQEKHKRAKKVRAAKGLDNKRDRCEDAIASSRVKMWGEREMSGEWKY